MKSFLCVFFCVFVESGEKFHCFVSIQIVIADGSFKHELYRYIILTMENNDIW